MGSSTGVGFFEIAFLIIIVILTVFLIIIVVCKIRQCLKSKPMLILNDIYSKGTNQQTDGIEFVEQLPRSSRRLVSDQTDGKQKYEKPSSDKQPQTDKPLDKSIDNSDMLKDVFSLEIDQRKSKKRKFHNAVVL